MDDENVVSVRDQWQSLLDNQTALFEKTITRNETLENRVDELEREVGVWKAALKSADEHRRKLEKDIHKLERNIGALKDDNPLLLCLIDGDGNIFSPELISMGQAGGHQAGMLLTKSLTDHVASLETNKISGRAQVWVTVYCNKNGLFETLKNNNMCTAEQFDAFVMGFNQASPLFSFVDVGIGKERADEKIKECLRVFTRFPQTARVFFGGAHDNGYISTLNYLQNEGLLHKLIVLRGYKDQASEVKNLKLPWLEIPGLFMSTKLYTPPKPKNLTLTSINYPTVQPQDFDKFRNKQTVKRSPSPAISTHSQSLKPLTPDLPLHRHKPPPCNFFYLSDCKHGDNCRYGHQYILLPEHIEELRTTSKKWPCPFINRGSPCPYGESCCMGHFCPKGTKCSFLKQKKCKFSDGMHRGYKGSRKASYDGSTPEGTPDSRSYSLPSPVGSPTKSSYGGATSPGLYPSTSSSRSLLSRLDVYDDDGWSAE